jgi:hypothetical protein
MWSRFACIWVLLIAPLVADAADLARIDRTIKKEPVYLSKSPQYALLVFGRKAQTRVWVVLDLVAEPWEKDGSKNALYIDRDGDGDLTGPSEKVTCTMTKHATDVSFSPQPSITYSPHFDAGDLVERDGKTKHTGLTIDVGSYIQRHRSVSLMVKVNGRYEQFAGGMLLKFADRPQDAPIIHFNGPLTFRLAMETGILHVPIHYDDKPDPKWYDEHPPKYEEHSLVRGESRVLIAQIGTPGLGRGTFAAVSAGLPPSDLHPAAELELPSAPGEKVDRLKVPLDSRCCGTLFRGTIALPRGITVSTAKVTFSFADWKDGQVAPATGEVAITNPVKSAAGGGKKE